MKAGANPFSSTWQTVTALAQAPTPKSRRRRQQILEAAAAEFIDKGYFGASIREIAERADARPSTIYYHFASKEDLVIAVHERGVALIHQATADAINDFDEPWQRLEAACIAHLNALLGGDVIFRAVMREMPRLFKPETQDRLRALRDSYELIFVQLLDDLVLPRGTDRHTLRLMLLGAMNWSFTWYRPGRDSPSELAVKFVRNLRIELGIEERRDNEA